MTAPTDSPEWQTIGEQFIELWSWVEQQPTRPTKAQRKFQKFIYLQARRERGPAAVRGVSISRFNSCGYLIDSWDCGVEIKDGKISLTTTTHFMNNEEDS